MTEKIIELNNVTVSSDEVFDNDPEVMFDCGFILPDGRKVYRYQNETYLFNGEHFEKYNPVMNLLWEDKIERIRNVVNTKSFTMIEGVMVDLFTASAIVNVYENINTKNKLRFLSKDIPTMADIAFKLLRK
jgi:hypothetical protein